MSTMVPTWYRVRSYLHFDKPFSLKRCRTIVTSPSAIAKHGFFPFLKCTLKATKFVKTETGKAKRTIKERAVAYASHLDSHIYAYYGELLAIRYEERLKELGLSDSVLAFRALGKSNVEFAEAAFQSIRKMTDCDVLALDVTGFFDNLDHLHLKAAWASILSESRLPADHFNVYKSITRWCWVEQIDAYRQLGVSRHNPRKDRRRSLCTASEFRQKICRPDLLNVNNSGRGIPQGSPISATLSNIYMLDFDIKMSEYAVSCGGAYFRYCDDILLLLPPGDSDQRKHFACELLRQLKLEIQPEKTDEPKFRTTAGALVSDKPLQYLGFVFDGVNSRIRPGSIARYLDRMARGVKVSEATRKRRNDCRLSRGEQQKPRHMKKLLRKYSYIGRRNFISYGVRASKTMSSRTIGRQLKPLHNRLLKLLPSPE